MVKQERIEFLADNHRYAKRFMYHIGRECRKETIQDVAKEHNLHWETVKELEKQYMREQIRRAGAPRPKVIGIDEVSIRKGHTYRIVVSDLERRIPIWFGGKDRSEESMDEFYAFLGAKSSKGIRLAVMDMWKAFRNSTNRNAPQAAILFDKFHVLRHLGEALDKVRKTEYARLTGKSKKFIKGQKIHLALKPRKSLNRWTEKSQASACCKQASQYRLRPQGNLRTIMELQSGNMGSEIL
jgi:transposase